MAITPGFENYEEVFSLQGDIVDDNDTVAQLARDVTMCGARSTTVDNNRIASDFRHLLAGIFAHLLRDPPTAIWDTNLPRLNANGIGAILLPMASSADSLQFSVVAAHHFHLSPDANFITGLMNADAFTRTKSFDKEGLSNGEIRFSIVDFGTKSPPDRLRFSTSSVDRTTISALRSLFATPTTTDENCTTFSSANYHACCSGAKFVEAITADSHWVREESTATSTHEMCLPAFIPLPQGHNLTIVKPVDATCAGKDTMLASFIASGVRPGSDLDWLLTNPVFQVWHASLLSSKEKSTPTSVVSSSFASIQRKTVYRSALSSYRKIAADWLKEVDDDPILFDKMLNDPQVVLEDEFPPGEVSITLDLPEPNPSFLISDERQALRPPQLPPLVPHLHSPLHPTRGGLLPSVPFHQASPSDFMYQSPGASSSSKKTYNATSKRVWQIWGSIDHSNRSRSGTEHPSPLSASLPDLNLWSPNVLSGTTSPLVAHKQSHFLCSPLQGGFTTSLDNSSSKTNASNMASSFKTRFLNYLDNGGQMMAHHLNGGLNRFFCTELFMWLMDATLFQRSLRKDTELDRFSLLHLCLLHSQVKVDPLTHSPLFPEQGFDSFDDIKAIIAAVKWFITNIFHRDWYNHTLLFQGIGLLESKCKELNFELLWNNDNSFSKAVASFVIVHSIHNLGALTAAMASNVSEDITYSAYLSTPANPDLTMCYLSPPAVSDPSFKADLNADITAWSKTLDVHLSSCGNFDKNDCLKSINNPEILQAISDHCLFFFHQKKGTTTPTFSGNQPSGRPFY